MFNIYAIHHLDVPIYVGLTKYKPTKRFADHKSTSKSRPKACPKLYNKMRKYPIEEFSIHLLEETCDEDRESYWIDTLNTIQNGCNIAKGGRVNRGFKHTIERKIIKSKESKQQYLSGKGLARWNGSVEQKEFLQRSRKGIVFTEQHCEQISRSKSDGPYEIIVDGKSHVTLSINKFAKEHNLNTATLRNSLWNNTQAYSKGHHIEVKKCVPFYSI